MPEVTCLMPIYNAGDHLIEAVNSVLRQSFSDFELIAIDDGSSDASTEVLKEMAKKDSRIVPVRNEMNLGLPATLNKGLRLAKGRLVARMDQDDICTEDRFQKQVDFLKNNPDVDVVGSWWKYFPEAHTISPPTSHDKIKISALVNNPMGHPTVMLRKDQVLAKVGFYNEGCFPIEDYEFWMRGLHKVRFANIPEVLLNYRIHPQQSSNLKAQVQAEQSRLLRVQVVNKVIPSLGLANDVVRIIDRKAKSRAEVFIKLGMFYFCNFMTGYFSRFQLAKFVYRLARSY